MAGRVNKPTSRHEAIMNQHLKSFMNIPISILKKIPNTQEEI